MLFRSPVGESLESDSMENEGLDERERPQKDGESTTSSQGIKEVLIILTTLLNRAKGRISTYEYFLCKRTQIDKKIPNYKVIIWHFNH